MEHLLSLRAIRDSGLVSQKKEYRKIRVPQDARAKRQMMHLFHSEASLDWHQKSLSKFEYLCHNRLNCKQGWRSCGQVRLTPTGSSFTHRLDISGEMSSTDFTAVSAGFYIWRNQKRGCTLPSIGASQNMWLQGALGMYDGMLCIEL